MARPGVNVIARSAPPSRSAPSDTGVWFVAGEAQKGPANEPVLLRNMDEYTRHFGARVSSSILYDALETYFREGGGRAYVSRIVGPGAALDTLTLGTSLEVSSIGPGDSGLSVEVIAGDAADTFRLVISDASGTLETSPDLGDPGASVNWASNNSRYINVSALSEDSPVVAAAAALAGGDDDRANITDDERTAALASQGSALGPGQVSIPGATTPVLHSAILVHAQAVNRVALLDAPNVSGAAALVTAANEARTQSDNISEFSDQFGGLFAPWAIIPGLTRGTTRTVPYSAVQAALISRRDAATRNPNEPAAGANGEAQYALGLAQASWSDAEREELNEAGVNTARLVFGNVRTYGYRTLGLDPNWLELSAARVRMAITHDADGIGEAFMFAQIDGRGRKIAEFGGALTGVLARYYNLGALYGDAPDEAFIVDVGSAVNTPETIADRQLRAVIGIRTSPFTEMITIEIVKVPITETL